MDFEATNDSEMNSEMIPIIPTTTYAEEVNYPTSPSAHTMQNGFKSVSNARLSSEQEAALEDHHEKDILELLQQMDDFEPIVRFDFMSFQVGFIPFLDSWSFDRLLHGQEWRRMRWSSTVR